MKVRDAEGEFPKVDHQREAAEAAAGLVD